MRVLGFGWAQFATPWSSVKDAHVGTVAHLKAHLLKIIEEELKCKQLHKLPLEAAPPPLRTRTMKQLGTPALDAQEQCMPRMALSTYSTPSTLYTCECVSLCILYLCRS